VSTRQVTQEEIDRALLAETPQQRLTQVDVSPWDIADVGAAVRQEVEAEARPYSWAFPQPPAATPVSMPTATRHLKIRFLRTETFEAELEAPVSLEVEDLTNKELQALVFRHALTKTTRTVNLDNDDIVIQSIEILPEKAALRAAAEAAPRKVFTLILEHGHENYDSPEVCGVYPTWTAADDRRRALADQDERDGLAVYYRDPDAERWDIDYLIQESEVEG
jgi:hypothetical protein